MRRLAIVVLLLVLAGCSSRAKPNATGSSPPPGTPGPGVSGSASSTPGAKPDASATSAAPSVSASARSTSKPKVVAPGAVVPAPGVYHYNQNGSIQPLGGNADPQGTLALGAPVADGGGQRQTQ